MTESLYRHDVVTILKEITVLMESNKDYLCQLDGAIGDGDIGLTMTKGFKAAVHNIPNITEDDIGSLFIQSGLAFNEAASSTMGTLMSSALFSAGKAIKGKNELNKGDLYLLFEGMVQGIVKRGKAQVGDKTILDSLVPSTLVLKEAAESNKTLLDALKAALEEAKSGVEKTVEMQSKYGRAARYLERSIGHQDPGATVGLLVIQAFFNYVSSNTE